MAAPALARTRKSAHVATTAVLLATCIMAFVLLSRSPEIGISLRSLSGNVSGRALIYRDSMRPTTRVCAVEMAGGGGKRIIISGAPASGKGTQCELIVKKYGVKHISTGDALRAHVRNQSELGKQAKAFMDAGDLVPDDLIMKIMREEALGDGDASGWLLDGVPRTAPQVEALNEAGLVPEAVILLEVPDDVLVERCVGRLFDPETGNVYHRTYFPPPADVADRCITRSDDNEETMRNRISQFKKNRQSLIDGYKGVVVSIDGNRDKNEVFKDICTALDHNTIAA
eukprot:CAMPEP_0184484920 /NCGR_PEP_ID=MMETSP0113_2-20130426/6585_1 /TAXON_ID=91329 /ORGANISM="Norrisiella sphaerica, Strain BC52" /LENGTH=284 /DNA_ID=CAMNT_0026866137 /DNA_START=12 /DNA_END=866 /DNA_ORIENTATION=-